MLLIFFNKIHIFPFQHILHLFSFKEEENIKKILKSADMGFAPPPRLRKCPQLEIKFFLHLP